MKTIAVFAAILAVALAAPQRKSQVSYQPHHAVAPSAAQYHAGGDVVLVKEVPSNNVGLDSYKFAYELSDGQKRDETAHVETLRAARSGEEPAAILRVQGSFSFVGNDGQTYTVNYVADENGFQPQGAHIPVV